MTTAILILFVIVMALAGESAWEHQAWVPAFVLWAIAALTAVGGFLVYHFDPDTLFERKD